MEITATIGCRNSCIYCPQDKYKKEYLKLNPMKEMSFQTFKKCLDKIPKDVHIHFQGFSEPWLSSESSRMILYAHHQGFELEVSTSLTGMALSDVKRIAKVPFLRFAVHMPEDQGKTNIKVDQDYLDLLNALINSNVANIAFHFHQGLSGHEGLHPKIKQLLKTNHVKWKSRRILTRAGNAEIDEKKAPQRTAGEILPCFRLKRNVLLPNGDVVLCCMDWGLKHRIGNLLDSNYDKLFKSDEYLRVLSALKNDSSEVLCRYCDIVRTKKSAEVQLANFIAKRGLNDS